MSEVADSAKVADTGRIAICNECNWRSVRLPTTFARRLGFSHFVSSHPQQYVARTYRNEPELDELDEFYLLVFTDRAVTGNAC